MANAAGQITSAVITSGVVSPATNRCVSCCWAVFAVGDRVCTCTVMLGLAASNAVIAAFVALPSLPRPCVANTIVWGWLEGCCEELLELPCVHAIATNAKTLTTATDRK